MIDRAHRVSLAVLSLSGAVLAAGCSGDEPGDDTPVTPTLRNGAPFVVAPVYEAVDYSAGFGVTRRWFPVDLAVHPGGELWVVQRMERDAAFDDESECTERGLAGNPNDCVSLQGSTVALVDPAAAEPASAANGRANLVVDANSWHFMRRPSGIAFGAPELTFSPGDPGAADANVTEPRSYVNTFATCAEHWTGNETDGGAFIGPTLWTADPAIYSGVNGSFDWSNGSHLDMVHATQYCMGIAYERANVYWTFNGQNGVLDRYDFGAPHFPGHYDHDDGDVTRYFMPEGDGLSRVPYVPSNLQIDGGDLYVADTGNGRVLRFDLTSAVSAAGSFFTHEGLIGTAMDGLAYDVIADRTALGGAWGGEAQPSGLALLDAETLVVANHATGHISLLDRETGEIVRTLDTGTGAGLGGVEVLDGRVYVVQMTQRRVLRLDVVETPATM